MLSDKTNCFLCEKKQDAIGSNAAKSYNMSTYEHVLALLVAEQRNEE